MISCACPRAYVGMSTLPPRSIVVSFMVSTIVLMESENGWGFWSASVASMMRRSMSLTSGSRADGMEKWSSMQMSPVWNTVAGPELSSTLAAPRMWPLSVSVSFASPALTGLPNGTGTRRFLTSWIGAPPVGFDPCVYQHLRRAEVQQVTAASHLAGPTQGAEGERRPGPGVGLDP